MPQDLPIRCQCGSLTGRVAGASPDYGNHCICYCDDCQAYARFLGRESEMLDPHGGTEIYQVSSGRVAFERGQDRLAAVRLGDKGLCRWYAACCRTPIANTMPTPAMPFSGLPALALVAEPSLDAVVGPVRQRVHGRFATGDRSKLDAHEGTGIDIMLRVSKVMLAGRLRGEHKKSPFFEATTGKPVVTPLVLDAKRRRDLDAQAPPT